MEIYGLLTWVDFRAIYSDKKSGEEEEEGGKNMRIPAKVILSCAWSDVVSGKKARPWREQMPQWETVLTFVSMMIIMNIKDVLASWGAHTNKGMLNRTLQMSI